MSDILDYVLVGWPPSDVRDEEYREEYRAVVAVVGAIGSGIPMQNLSMRLRQLFLRALLASEILFGRVQSYFLGKLSIYKRGSIYWYKFTFNGEAIRESTRQKNQVVARNMESAHRTSLAQGEVGIRDKKPAPTLRDFCDQRFEPWAKSSFEKNTLNNWLWYRAGIRSLLSYKPLQMPSSMRLAQSKNRGN